MEDVGDADDFGCFNNGAAEEAESLRVVGIVARWGCVKAFAVEQFGAIDKVCLHSFVDAAVEDPYETVIGRKRNGHAGKNDAGVGNSLRDLPVVRDKYADLVAHLD